MTPSAVKVLSNGAMMAPILSFRKTRWANRPSLKPGLPYAYFDSFGHAVMSRMQTYLQYHVLLQQAAKLKVSCSTEGILFEKRVNLY